ncbi:hypothetical protein HED60_08505 [Planctomycetales bacterium ZRK34]|nr:hypothetical protein HED60_08505 [Planctomycetales bacterium ZRK34]
MIIRRTIVVIWVLAGSFAGSGLAQPIDVVGQLTQVRQSLLSADVAAAVQRLNQLRQQADRLTPAQRHQVDLIFGQITGAFAPRQAAWSDRKVIDTVVLVDNELMLMRAIGAWQDDAFYPVLLNDGWYSRLFIEAFKPSRVVHIPSGVMIDPTVAAETAVKLIARQNARMIVHREANAAPPPGLVVIDPAGPHRTAGLALAIGRGQPILTAAGVPDPMAPFAAETITQLAADILSALGQWRLASSETWVGLTLAARLPYFYKAEPTTLPANAQIKLTGPRALDDLLGRNNQGVRFAIAGRLTGDAARANYQAMCALFLQPKNALLIDDYPTRPGNPIWKTYSLDQSEKLFAGRFPIQRLTGDGLNIAAIRTATAPRHRFDLLWVNSSGSPHRFAIHGPDEGTADDIPLGRAAAFNVVHSMSAADPWDADTLAGRALAGGAYWYFGSMNEPYLSAFVEPEIAAVKILAGCPLAFALHHGPDHPFYMPWKLVCLGDPLYSLRDTPAQRINAPLPLNGAHPQPPHELDPPDLAEADDLSPGDLASAVYHHFVEGDYPAILKLDPILARRHPIATACYRQVLAQRYAKLLNANELDDARAALTRLLILGGDKSDLTHHARQWLMQMARTGNKPAAINYLKALAAQSLPAPAKQALTDLID